MDSDYLFKRFKHKAVRGNNMEVSKKLMKIFSKKYFYHIRMVDEWNRMTEDMVNANSINKSKKQYDNREFSRDGPPQV